MTSHSELLTSSENARKIESVTKKINNNNNEVVDNN